MDNRIKKEALKILANAPAIAARDYLRRLDPVAREEAERLFTALGVFKSTDKKNNTKPAAI